MHNRYCLIVLPANCLELMMTTPLVINLCWGILMLGLSYSLAMHNALHFYPETLPTICQAGLSAVLAFIGIVLHRLSLRLLFLLLSSLAIALLLLPMNYASSHWPGGDDGGALGWFIIMGGASLISCFTALITTATGCVMYLQHKKLCRPPHELRL